MTTPVPTLAKRGDKAVPSLSLLVASLAVLGFAAYPLYVIQPFREQTSADLERALWVLEHNKPLVLTAAVVIAVAFLLWRRAGWIAKSLLIPATGIAVLAGVSVWINPSESEFHPVGVPKYLQGNLAKINANDMVIAVTQAEKAVPILFARWDITIL